MIRIALAALVALFAGSGSAQEIQVKLGTLAPQGSTWHNLLKELGERMLGQMPAAITSGLLAKVREFAAGAPQSDDITMLCLRYLGATH